MFDIDFLKFIDLIDFFFGSQLKHSIKSNGTTLFLIYLNKHYLNKTRTNIKKHLNFCSINSYNY